MLCTATLQLQHAVPFEQVTTAVTVGRPHCHFLNRSQLQLCVGCSLLGYTRTAQKVCNTACGCSSSSGRSMSTAATSQPVPGSLLIHLQGYYRRGDANFMLGKFKEALKDLKTVSNSLSNSFTTATECAAAAHNITQQRLCVLQQQTASHSSSGVAAADASHGSRAVAATTGWLTARITDQSTLRM